MKTSKAVKKYKREELPSDTGVTVKPLKGKTRSFIPDEALQASRNARKAVPKATEKIRKPTDVFSDERMDRSAPAVDSSEETLGG